MCMEESSIILVESEPRPVLAFSAFRVPCVLALGARNCFGHGVSQISKHFRVLAFFSLLACLGMLAFQVIGVVLQLVRELFHVMSVS